eukprot:CAMPEP_0177668684 /NCGR_PEP_ID=MMETSP0447-20121125/22932_1 /TAXON_ID=0 /ORGANISM="Stygamoeba regulata, Strain BSH-02190019" /LENGTH=88 /DNA_ID=CAMNT_0019175287 /DNA_START=31 /DNA_END=293 /DNA_ORIENTATION=+
MESEWGLTPENLLKTKRSLTACWRKSWQANDRPLVAQQRSPPSRQLRPSVKRANEARGPPARSGQEGPGLWARGALMLLRSVQLISYP